MLVAELAVLLIAYASSVAVFAAVALVLSENKKLASALVAASLLGVAAAVWIAAATQPNGNALMQIWQQLVGFNRPAVSAALLGLGLASPWLLIAFPAARLRWLSGLAAVAYLCTLAVGSLIAGKELISPYLPHPESTVSGRSQVNADVHPSFELQSLGELQVIPIRIAVDQETGKVFVSGNSGIAAQHGVIVELQFDEAGRVKRERIVTSGLNRPHGLAIRDGDIYVSRSGQFAKWTNGKAEHMLTGAVTVLKDLDKDGSVDLIHDLVRDMPGALAPDYLHQNNAIAFDKDGALYITSGISSDSHPGTHPWEGTILRAKPPAFDRVEVFAKGLRNTFGLAMSPKGHLFASDNDAQSGEVGNLGDKLLVARKGDDFGHPYARPGAPGVAPPILLSKFALGGITFSSSNALTQELRDSLYVVSYGEGRVLRYPLTADGASVVKERVEPFALVASATDMAAAPNGDFYVISYEKRTLHRIRLKR